MDMLPRRKPGRPKGSKNKKATDYEKTYGEDKFLKVLKEMESYKEQINLLTAKIQNIDKNVDKKEEKIVPIDDKVLSTGTLLNVEQRTRLEKQVKEYENMLRTKETALGRFYGKNGFTDCFVDNAKTDQRIIISRLVKAKRALDLGVHGKVSNNDRNKLFQEKIKLEKMLKDTLPSMSACNDKAKADDLAAYLGKHQSKYGQLMKRLQNINKLLEPDNPAAGRLRYLWRD